MMDVIIFTDSESALQFIRKMGVLAYHNWYVLNIKSLMFQLRMKIRAIVWIPGQAGIPGKETVDIMAKDTTQFPTVIHYAATTEDQETIFQQVFFREWQHTWETQINTNPTKHFKE
jgi:ribonuclease HI